MSDTRTPTGQDLVCLVCRTDKDIDIDHVQNRGMGGSKERDVPENKVPLCRECHTAKTNGVLETRLTRWHADGRGLISYQWRRIDADIWITVPVEVSKRYKCLILSDGAEEAVSPRGLAGHKDTGRKSSSAPSPSVRQEESDGKVENVRLGHDTGPSSATSTLSAVLLTHDQRAAIAAGIKEMEWGRQWLAGDTANEWEEELGEKFWNEWANEFGYTYPSLRNNQRVCAAIPEKLRYPSLRFSHHVVVMGLGNLEDMDEALEECAREGWSVSEFRRQVKGERPRVKRYSVEELHAEVAHFGTVSQKTVIHAFIDFMAGEQ